MTSPASNTEPTAEQLETAWQAVRPDYNEMERRWTSRAQHVQVDRVARALAAAVTAERDKYLRVADELDGLRKEAEEWQARATRQHHTYDSYWNRGRALAYTSGARRIREVAG